MIGWFRVEGSILMHPKVIGLSDPAFRTWVHGLAWVSEHRTDGAIPKTALTIIRGRPRLAAELVRAGLWHEVEGGWEVHDYLEHNLSRAEIEARSASASHAARKRWAR